jgi:hypothetical protein
MTAAALPPPGAGGGTSHSALNSLLPLLLSRPAVALAARRQVGAALLDKRDNEARAQGGEP